jgi:phosphoserine phosphatase RsbU/P
MFDIHDSQISLLLDAIARINSRSSLEAVLGTIMDAAKEIMEAEASSLMMLDVKTRELIITLPTGPVTAQISGRRLPPGKGFAGWVAEHGEPLVIADASTDPRFFGDVAKETFQTHSLMCVPLRDSQGQVIGVLQALNRRNGSGFGETDIPLFTAFADQAAIAIEKSWLHEAQLAKQRIEQQLALARDIQQGFWPGAVPAYESVALAGKSRPAAEVGGDYYDIVPLDTDHCALIVADVSGKGLPAAMIMAAVRGALRAQIESAVPMEQVTAALNRMLVRDTPAGKFVSLFWGILDIRSLWFKYINAGHNPPLLFSGQTGEVSRLEEGGAVLGVVASLPYAGGSVRLESGDTLVMFTDGITEAQNAAEEMYGEERLTAMVREAPAGCNASELLEMIDQEVVLFAGSEPQYDDCTLVLARVR